ncbi:N-acetyltransferase [Rhizobium sp. CSW-27]|uniref:GNAT family N-acetyltransferase n=1 Tax=Rhizobium sp. CSW-27 TaxID=2839985 RepID=UPI001C00FA1F|nr:N-acetyltransferase [Rhizobium sp. CSW-27]
MIIRAERPGDEAAIGAVTAAAFAGKSYSDQTEPQIIDQLRAAAALKISLVAEDGEGIGSALIRRGLDTLAGLRASGCALVGSPKFYPRFGFRQCRELTYPGLPVEYFMVLLLRGGMPSGIVRFHPAFYGSAA